MKRLLLVVVASLILTGGFPFADDAPAAKKPQDPKEAKLEEAPKALPLNEREQAFADLLKDAALVGNFTVEGGKRGGPDTGRHKDRYVIKSAIKVGVDSWLINSQIVYGKFDVTVPVPVKVYWADDTPVMSVTDLSIPLMGSEFGARVLFFDNRYAGTWSHGKVGGLMFGTIERADAPTEGAEKPEATPKPEKS
jgi:hypothetical protein